MASLSRCPACGAPLPGRWGPRGVTCDYCNTFLSRELLEGGPAEEAMPPAPEPVIEEPVFVPQPAPDAVDTWRDEVRTVGQVVAPQASRIGRKVIWAIVAVVVLICLSCVCALAVLREANFDFLNSF